MVGVPAADAGELPTRDDVVDRGDELPIESESRFKCREPPLAGVDGAEGRVARSITAVLLADSGACCEVELQSLLRGVQHSFRGPCECYCWCSGWTMLG